MLEPPIVHDANVGEEREPLVVSATITSQYEPPQLPQEGKI